MCGVHCYTCSCCTCYFGHLEGVVQNVRTMTILPSLQHFARSFFGMLQGETAEEGASQDADGQREGAPHSQRDEGPRQRPPKGQVARQGQGPGHETQTAGLHGLL